MIVQAFRSAIEPLWILRVDGETVDRRDRFALRNVQFVIDEADRVEANRRGKRTNHAGPVGELVDFPETLPGDLREVVYNPEDGKPFRTRESEETLTEAPLVVFMNWKCYAVTSLG